MKQTSERYPEEHAAGRTATAANVSERERDESWVIVEDGFVLSREHEIESVFAIGNGLVGSRGSLAEGSALSAPTTYVAGVFDNGRGTGPALARAPDWAQLTTWVEGTALNLDAGHPLEHRRVLDMRHGTLWRYWRHRDVEGRITRLDELRFASLADRRVLVQSVSVTPENYSGTLTLESRAFSRTVSVRTVSGMIIELAASSHIESPEGRWGPPRADDDKAAPERWTIEVELGRTYRLDRMASVHVTRDGHSFNARTHVQQVQERGIEGAVGAHRKAWSDRWERADVVIEGDAAAQRAVRFAMYHLMSAANPDDPRVSIGARALTGPAYKGHVFWDTEIYMLPFFTLTWPEAARSLLMYRLHTLPAARARAAELGYRGALYAWESADTGEDVTPSVVVAPTGEVVRLRVAEEEQHISADVAYAVWNYWKATLDEEFLLQAGAEILVETARFWASRAQREDDGRYHIRRVIGPDEYHESVDDDAYTNGMARWNLEVGSEAAALLSERWPERWRELAHRLRLADEELRDWSRVAQDMYVSIDPRTGVIEQFDGYFGLEDIDLAKFEPRTAPMDVLLGRERVQRSKIIKQPDVLMLLHLLWDRYPAEVREANFLYYEPRTGHGSSLSPSVHAVLAARLGKLELAKRYFDQTAEIDLANKMGNAAGGVHAAALGGLWQAVVFGFAGLSLSTDAPRLVPCVPKAWCGIHFNIVWRGVRVPVDVRPGVATTIGGEAHA